MWGRDPSPACRPCDQTLTCTDSHVEVMSIHPENHLTETRQIVKPDLVLVTNSKPGWFGENLDLVCAAARSLDIDDETIVEGIRRTRSDAGTLRIRRYQPTDLDNPCFLVNAFAANDTESTVAVHDKVSLFSMPNRSGVSVC